MALKEKALKRMAEKLNAAGLCWALEGDFVLCRKGAADTWHTFDLVCAEADRPAVDKVLTRLGMRHEEEDGAISYHFDGADIRLEPAVAFAMSHEVAVETEPVLGVSVPMLTLVDMLAVAKANGNEKQAERIETILQA